MSDGISMLFGALQAIVALEIRTDDAPGSLPPETVVDAVTIRSPTAAAIVSGLTSAQRSTLERVLRGMMREGQYRPEIR